MGAQDVKQLKKSVNYRFGVATVGALAELMARWSCKPTAAVERAILEAMAQNVGIGEQDESALEGEAGTIARWWMRQDGMTEREVIEAALVVYDGFRQNATISPVPSTLPDASVAARAAAAAKAARESQDREVPSAAEIAGVHVGIGNLPKNAQCKHCGQKFAGPKGVIVCPACKEAGHADDPHGCGECFNRDGPG